MNTSIVDTRYAPMMHREITFGPVIPWLNYDIKELKAKRRKLTKKMLKSNRRLDKEACREVCNKYIRLLDGFKQQHYTYLINQCAGDSKKLFQIRSGNDHTMTVQRSQIIFGIFSAVKLICQERKLITSILIRHKLTVILGKFYCY